MYCPNCGTKVDDGARFCPECGCRLDASEALEEQATSGPTEGDIESGRAEPEETTPLTETDEVESDTPAQETAPLKSEAPALETNATSQGQTDEPSEGSLNYQVSQARKTTRKKMPLFLLVTLVVLGVASLAFAATMIWTYVLKPGLDQRHHAPAAATAATAYVSTSGEALTAATSPAAATDATPATQSPTTAATTTPATSSSTTAATNAVSPTPETTQTGTETQGKKQEDAAAQKALFNDILSQYKAAQDRGWTKGADTEPEDLQMLEEKIEFNNRVNNNDDKPNISYAFADLGNDGILDLVVGMPGEDGRNAIYGIFLSNGKTITSVMRGDLIARSWWSILDNGTIINYGSGGAYTGGTTVYKVQSGNVVKIDTYGKDYDPSSTPGNAFSYYYHGNKKISEYEYKALQNAHGEMKLNWVPLSKFNS